jgi:hypothetical protein
MKFLELILANKMYMSTADLKKIIARLRPSHRKQYMWLLKEAASIAEAEEMEEAMSRYTGIYALDGRELRVKLVSEFGAKFQQSLYQFLVIVHSRYGFDAINILSLWEVDIMPHFIYAEMMDQSQEDMMRMIADGDIPF